MLAMNKSKKSINKIILFGSFGPAFLAFSRVCRRSGIKVYLLEISDKNTGWHKYSSCLSGGSSIPSDKFGTTEGIGAIKNYAGLVQADALAALSDSHILWFAENKSNLESCVKVLTPDPSPLKMLRSKRDQIELAKQVGFNVLFTKYLFCVNDCMNIPLKVFPICIRPVSKDGMRDEFKAKVFFSLDRLVCYMRNHDFSQTSFVAQPFLNLPNLVIHGVRSEEGQILSLKAFLAERKFEGFALSLREIEPPPGIEGFCCELVEKINLIGCFHYDFLFSKKENCAYFLEINARLGGTTDKVLSLGFNEPLLLLKAYGFNLRAEADVNHNKYPSVVNKKAILKHIQYSLLGRLSDLDFPIVSRCRHILSSIYELLFVKDSIFDWGDIRGTLWFYLHR